MEDDIVLRVLGPGDAWPRALAALDDLHHPHAGQVSSRWEEPPVRH